MAAIKSKHTRPELVVRKLVRSLGYSYRLNVQNLPGKPDIVIKNRKTVILINGCFWHQHQNCRFAAEPKSNVSFWKKKLDRNKLRDKENIGKLRKMRYKVIVVWECQVKKMLKTGSNTVVNKLLKI